ncbi:hypothetical protein [Nocardia asteroides]|uniref:hypothetical protein n=1 Tax=Nocardia asteroides TaxID=1824 RepID=UPI003654B689
MSKTYHGGTSYHPRRPLLTTPGNPARPTIAEQHRHLRALELFATGLTYQAIADELGYSHRASAFNAVWKTLARGSARTVPEHHQRQDAAAWLRAEGWVWQDIAEELGYTTRSGAYRAAGYARNRRARADTYQTILAADK